MTGNSGRPSFIFGTFLLWSHDKVETFTFIRHQSCNDGQHTFSLNGSEDLELMGGFFRDSEKCIFTFHVNIVRQVYMKCKGKVWRTSMSVM
jgi:hypothetical protein